MPEASPPYILPEVRELEPPDIFPAPKQPGPRGSLMPAENIAFFVGDEPAVDEPETSDDTVNTKEESVVFTPYEKPSEEERKTLAHPMDVFFMVEPFGIDDEITGAGLAPAPLQPPPLSASNQMGLPRPRASRHLEEAQTLDVPVVRGILPSEADIDTSELILEEEGRPSSSSNLSIHSTPSHGDLQDLALMSTQEVPTVKPNTPPSALSASALELQLEEMGGALGVTLESSGGSLDNLDSAALAPTEKLKTIKPPASMRGSVPPPPPAMPVLMGKIIEEELSPKKDVPIARSATADSMAASMDASSLLDDFEDFPTDERPPSNPLEDDLFQDPLGDSLDGSKLSENELHTRKLPTLGSMEDLLEPGSRPGSAAKNAAPAVTANPLLPSKQACPNGELHIWLFPKLSLDTMSFLYQFAGQCQLMVQKALPTRPPRQANLGCLYTEEETCLQWSGDTLLLQIVLPSVLESFGQLQPPQLKQIAEKLQLKDPLHQQPNALQVARQILIGTRPFAHALRDGISQLGQSQISLLHSALHGSTEVLFESSTRTPTPDPLREQRLMLSYQIQVNIPIQVLERRLEESFSLSLYQIVPKRLPLELIYLGIVHHFDLRNQIQELIGMLREIAPKLDLAPFHTYAAMRNKQRRAK
ncbi:MAG: hypothetical protein H6727_11660 [Myxococcales bacterium]|nr:hypothetical protein [Myxococcales bacterium]